MLNLEENGIESWEELQGFRTLKDFQKLIVNKNRIKSIESKPGWPAFTSLSIEDNLIDDWNSFNELNEFGAGSTGTGHAAKIQHLRCEGNPLIPRFKFDCTPEE